MSPSVAVIGKQSIGFADQGLLSRLPEHLLTRLFGAGTTVRLNTDEVLFLAGDTGDGCYRVEDGLLKVTMISRTGKERIPPFSGRAQSLVRCRSSTDCHVPPTWWRFAPPS